MSSLTRLLQEKSKDEQCRLGPISSLQADAALQQGLVREPIKEERIFPSMMNVGKVHFNNDIEASRADFHLFVNTNLSPTSAFQGCEASPKNQFGSLNIGKGNSLMFHSGRSIPSLSHSIPYSVPNFNTGCHNGSYNEHFSVGSGNNTSSWTEKYGNSLPRNISPIDSNVISSPKVDSVEPRFVISTQKLQTSNVENGSVYALNRSHTLSSHIYNFFFKKGFNDLRGSETTSKANNSSNRENVNYAKSVPRPIGGRRSSLSNTCRHEDLFNELPPSNNAFLNYHLFGFRHTLFTDLKRFFRKNGSSGQLTPPPDTPPFFTGSISSQTFNCSSSLTSPSCGTHSAETLYNNSACSLSQELPFSKRYSKTGGKLGAGAGGSVKILKRIKDGTIFAVKEFRSKYDSETKRDYIKKIISEYCIGISLCHPNIIHSVEIAFDGNRILQVMEYCDYDLFAIVISNKMSYGEIYCCFKQILVGIGYLHSLGLAHRDLKLDNCVINNQGIVKLIDFGAAVVFTYPHSGTLVEASGIVGSDPYLAPEVCIFTKYDPRAVDIWSVAIIFSCMILKKFPWKIPKLKDESFKLFCLGRSSDSLATLVSLTPDPPSYSKTVGEESVSSSLDSNSQSNHSNPNIGSQRLLQFFPEETHHILGRMLDLAPACRAPIEEIMADKWIQSIDMCFVSNSTGKVVSGEAHSHTEVDQTEAHIAVIGKKKKNLPLNFF